MLHRRTRPLSAVPVRGRKKKEVPKKFSDPRTMNAHVNHMYEGDYESGRKCACESCQEGEALHHWPDRKKIKYVRPLKMKVLKSLYGSRADLILPKSARKTRPNSALPKFD